MTLIELARLRTIALRSEGRSPRTIEQLEVSLKRFLKYLGTQGDIPCAEAISATHLRAFALRLAADGLQPSSQSFHVRALRALFRWAHLEELLDSNPGERVRPPKVPRKIVPAPDDSQIKALIESSRRSRQPMRNVAIVSLLYDAGFRASEILGLELEDINWDFQQVRIRHGKGDKERVVPVGFQSLRALARYVHKERQAPLAVKAVFIGRERAPFTYTGLLQLIRRLARDAGLGIMSPHKLRHGFARAFLRNGGDVFSLQRILGHTTLEMSRRYVELAFEDVQHKHQGASPMDRLGKARY